MAARPARTREPRVLQRLGSLLLALGCIVYLLVNRYGDAVRIQPHNDAPRQVNVFHNTVVVEGSGIVITRGGAGKRQAVLGNALFGRNPVVDALHEANLAGQLAPAAAYLAPPELRIDTSDLSVGEAVQRILLKLEHDGYLR